MDQAFLLGAAIKCMQYLQQRVRALEEQAAHPPAEDDSGEPEIKARICNRTVLVEIQCGKRKGIIVKILDELEKMNLGIANLSVATLGSSELDITIVAKMEKGFNLSTIDVMRALRSALHAVSSES